MSYQQDPLAVLGEILDNVSGLVQESKEMLLEDSPGQIAITACKKHAIHLMSLLKEATRTISTMLEQTKEEKAASKLNALTYFIDDMYRLLEPKEPSSVTSCLRDDMIEGARSSLERLEGNVKELKRLYEEFKDLHPVV